MTTVKQLTTQLKELEKTQNEIIETLQTIQAADQALRAKLATDLQYLKNNLQKLWDYSKQTRHERQEPTRVPTYEEWKRQFNVH